MLNWIVFLVTLYPNPTINSGPQAGDGIPGPFLTFHVNGPLSGKIEQPICDLQMRPRPFMFLFAQKVTPKTLELIRHLDHLASGSKKGDLISVVFLSDDPKLTGCLKEFIQSNNITHAVLSITPASKLPADWKIANGAALTAIAFNRRRIVVSNASFKKDELDAKMAKRVLAAYSAISSK